MMTKRRTTQAPQTIERQTYTPQQAEVAAHGAMVSFLTKTETKFQDAIARFNERAFGHEEYALALSNALGWAADDLVKLEFQRAHAKRIMLDERSTTAAGLLEVCSDAITELTERVMSGDFAHNSTSPMHNAISMWQSLAAIDFIKYLKLEMRMAKYILQDAREVG